MDEIPKISNLSERYITERNLNKSNGIVDLARKVNDESKNLYALKNSENTPMNRREIILLRKLSHPHIITIEDAFIIKGVEGR